MTGERRFIRDHPLRGWSADLVRDDVAVSPLDDERIYELVDVTDEFRPKPTVTVNLDDLRDLLVSSPVDVAGTRMFEVKERLVKAVVEVVDAAR